MRPPRVVLADGGLVSRRDALSLAERAGFELVGEAPGWAQIAELISSRSAQLVLATGDVSFLSDADGVGVPIMALIPDGAAAAAFAESSAYAVVSADWEPDVVAALARLVIARATDLDLARHETEALRQQLDTRKLVERAKGVLMRRLGIDEDAAYKKMQKASQDDNRKLRDVADSILAAERLYGEPKETIHIL